MTLAEFRVSFDEFASAPDAKVSDALATAEDQLGSTMSDTDRSRLVGLYAARSLHMSPGGRAARGMAAAVGKVTSINKTPYDTEIKRLITVNAGARLRIW